MNRIILHTSLLLLLLAGFSAGPAMAQQKEIITFDIKTPFAEKPDLAPAKNGAVVILMGSDWGGVREYGEDYALWLRNISRRNHDDSITVTLTVELRTSSLFGKGELLDSRDISATYHPGDDWARYGTADAVRLIRGVETCAEVGMTVAGIFCPVGPLFLRTAAEGIENVMPGDLPQMKLEAMILGAKAVAAAREMAGSGVTGTHE